MGRYVVQGLTSNSMFNMVLDAGAVFEDLNITGGETAEEVAEILKLAIEDGRCLGATSGGGSFKAVPETRQIEADGARYAVVGSTVFDSWNVSLTTTLKEITQANMQRVFPTAEFDGTKGSFRIKTALTREDYIPHLWWVGNRNDDSFVLIDIFDAVNILGAEATYTDKGEMTLPVEFKAHASKLEDMEYAPFEWYFLGE